MQKLPFSELGLSEPTLKAVEKLGFEQTSPIQSATIPVLMAGRDVVGQSATGSGKTAAFAIPAIERVKDTDRKVQILVLTPTRELCVQVAEEFSRLSFFRPKVHAVPIYGGASYDRQFSELRKGPQIVIGTPGRVIDHLQRNTLDLSEVKMAILDECDRMLDMGFREDMERILSAAPKERQTVFFSATLPPVIRRLIEQFAKSPEHIRIETQTLTVPTVEQVYFDVPPRAKLDALGRLIDIHDARLTIVFANTQRTVDEIADALLARGYSADRLHGGISQALRTRTMGKFKRSEFEILVATDVASRGLDVDDLDLVINYDLPYDPEDYVHRIGRTGRAGRKGVAMTLVSGREVYRLQYVERFTRQRIRHGRVPTWDQVEEKRLSEVLDKVRATLEAGHHTPHAAHIDNLLDEGLAATDLAAALLHQLLAAEGIETKSQSEPDPFAPRQAQSGAAAPAAPQPKPKPSKPKAASAPRPEPEVKADQGKSSLEEAPFVLRQPSAAFGRSEGQGAELTHSATGDATASIFTPPPVVAKSKAPAPAAEPEIKVNQASSSLEESPPAIQPLPAPKPKARTPKPEPEIKVIQASSSPEAEPAPPPVPEIKINQETPLESRLQAEPPTQAPLPEPPTPVAVEPEVKAGQASSSLEDEPATPPPATKRKSPPPAPEPEIKVNQGSSSIEDEIEIESSASGKKLKAPKSKTHPPAGDAPSTGPIVHPKSKIPTDLPQPAPGYKWITLHAGKADGLAPRDIVDAITEGGDVPGKAVGLIKLHDHETHVQIQTASAAAVVEGLEGATLGDKELKVHFARTGAPPGAKKPFRDRERDDRPPFRRDADRPAFRRDDDRPPFRRDDDRPAFRRDDDRPRPQGAGFRKGPGSFRKGPGSFRKEGGSFAKKPGSFRSYGENRQGDTRSWRKDDDRPAAARPAYPKRRDDDRPSSGPPRGPRKFFGGPKKGPGRW